MITRRGPGRQTSGHQARGGSGAGLREEQGGPLGPLVACQRSGYADLDVRHRRRGGTLSPTPALALDRRLPAHRRDPGRVARQRGRRGAPGLPPLTPPRRPLGPPPPGSPPPAAPRAAGPGGGAAEALAASLGSRLRSRALVVAAML